MRRLYHSAKQAAEAVWAYKLRTLFCLLSVALGVSSIAIIVAATEGAYQRAYEMAARFGPDTLAVYGGSDESRARGQREQTIKLSYVEKVREAFPTAYLLIPYSTKWGVNVSFRNKKYQTRVVGSSANFTQAHNWPVIQGSDLSGEDVNQSRNVALIGQDLTAELFGSEEPIGKSILVNRVPVQIIGALGARGVSGTGHSLDNRLVMPITTVMKKVINERQYIRGFRIKFLDQSNLDRRVKELTAFLRNIMDTPDDQPNQFRIMSPTLIIQFLAGITGSLLIFIGTAGIVCLVVAGFVLANLFLLSVKERTKEIGIRRAVGARRRDIRRQFLSEAVIVTSCGGALGFVMAVAGSKLLVYVAEFPMVFSWRAFLVGMTLSWIVGVTFGLQPASQAANIEPIEAIRG